MVSRQAISTLIAGVEIRRVQTLLLLSWAVVLAPVNALAGPVVFIVYITYFQIGPEKRMMLSKFGTAYRDYSARTRRWL